MKARTNLSFAHIKSNGYVHAYRRGRVVALYNSLNLNAAFLLDVPEHDNLDIPSLVPKPDLDKLKQLGLNLSGGWSGGSEVIRGLQDRVADEAITTVFFIPAMACNYRCEYCQFIQEFDDNTNYARMTTGQARELVDTFYKMSAAASPRSRDFVFFGGEPFIAANIVQDVLTYIRDDLRDHDININAFTNGSLITDEIAATCARYNLYAIVSIDGPAQVNDQARVDLRLKATFDKTVRGYRKLQEAGCKMGISIMAGRHNVDSLAESVQWLIEELNPDEIGIAGVFHPLKNRRNPYQADPLSVVEALIRTYVACRERGVYVDQVARRLRPFVSMRPKLKDCMACGGKIIATPWGIDGHCEYISFMKNSPKRGLVQLEIKNNEPEDWNRRSPVAKLDCQNCPALGVCGSGCPYNSLQLQGSLDALDEDNCEQTRFLLAWMIEDLFETCERTQKPMSDNIIFPTPSDRQALFGAIDATNQSLPLKAVSRHGE